MGTRLENAHTYHVVAWWASGRTGLAKSGSATNAIHFTAPEQFGGVDGRWTPEDLLLAALASCFTITFQSIAEHSGFGYVDLQVETMGTVSKTESGYGFSDIITRTSLTILDEKSRYLGTNLLQRAAELCLVSRTLTKVPKVEIRIEVRKQFAGL